MFRCELIPRIRGKGFDQRVGGLGAERLLEPPLQLVTGTGSRVIVLSSVSAAVKFRRALLGERGHTFAQVLAGERGGFE
jgi:hypothetical protein